MADNPVLTFEVYRGEEFLFRNDLSAESVTHDQESRDLIYRDAYFEVGGVPVAYLPYIRHPDPTVKKRSGFLAPTFGRDSELGLTAEIPYFWNIAPNRDLTIAPISWAVNALGVTSGAHG